MRGVMWHWGNLLMEGLGKTAIVTSTGLRLVVSTVEMSVHDNNDVDDMG